MYASVKTKIALRMTKTEYASLGYPPDALTETLTKWSDANHR